MGEVQQLDTPQGLCLLAPLAMEGIHTIAGTSFQIAMK